MKKQQVLPRPINNMQAHKNVVVFQFHIQLNINQILM